MRVCLILEVYCFSSIRFWWHSCGRNQTGRTIQEKLCIYPVFPRLSKWTNLKADTPQTPVCPIVRPVGEPVLHVCLPLRPYWTLHLLVSGLQAATCIFHTETLHYKSLFENLGRSRAEPYTCTSTTLNFFSIQVHIPVLPTCYSASKHCLFMASRTSRWRGSSSTRDQCEAWQ